MTSQASFNYRSHRPNLMNLPEVHTLYLIRMILKPLLTDSVLFKQLTTKTTMNPLFSLQNKTALITGGTGKLGGFMAKALMSAGATVYITGRDAKKVSEQSALYSENSNGSCIGLAADINSEVGIQQLVRELSELDTGFDILINNAAASKVASLNDTSFKDWQDILTTNVTAVFELTKQMIPLLSKSASAKDPARVINIGSSLASHAGAANSFAYATSKAALEHMTKNLANELAPKYVSVNCLNPGVFPSPMFDQYLTDDFGLSDIENAMPMKRMGQESDLAGTIIYLCSPASAYMTGAKIALDGGDSIRF